MRSKIEAIRLTELEQMGVTFLALKVLRFEKALDSLEFQVDVLLQDEGYREEMLKHKEDR